jgi:CHAT domain-containing protein
MPVGRSRARSSAPPGRTASTRRIALVAAVGEPRLEQVKSEVGRIKERMEQDWPKGGVQIDVLVSDEADAPAGGRFREVLLSRDYDIVHFAGHAAFDPRRPDQSSLLLDGGEVCFAQKIQRLLAGHPLVFLNACETARLAAPQGWPAAEGTYEGDPKEGLASAFVYGGALACVGATWPVRDDIAAEFAVAFYSMALEGRSLGQAILEARRHTALAYPDDPSWAAFVLYGDPAFRWAALTA